MRLVCAELYKVWTKRIFIVSCIVLFVVNLFLLWTQTCPAQDASPAAAYKCLEEDLAGLSMEEKKTMIEQTYNDIDAIIKIDQILQQEAAGSDEYTRAYRRENADLFQEYQTLYDEGTYLRYTKNLYQEYQFLEEIKSEFEVVEGYGEYLENIQKKSKQLSVISIFTSTDGDSFDQQSIKTTAKAYEDIKNVLIDYSPQKGLVTALDFRLTDLVLIFSILLLAFVLVRDEKDSGLLSLVRSMPAGRKKNSVSKAVCSWLKSFGNHFDALWTESYLLQFSIRVGRA